MPRPRIDSSLNNIIEDENWDVVISQLKSDDKDGLTRYASRSFHKKSPLHLVCEHNPPVEVVSILLKLNIETARKPSTPQYELPLHLAVGPRQASLEVIKLLLRANPMAVRAQTSEDYGSLTPLHVACTFGVPYVILKEMVVACPEAIHIRDKYGRTPWDIAKVQYTFLNPRSWPVLFLLNERTGSLSPQRTNGMVPLSRTVNAS